MRELLYVDCCIRGPESRTAQLAEAFLSGLGSGLHVSRLPLTEQALRPLTGEFFAARQRLLDEGALSHPRFALAHQFAQADEIMIAAPFWDLAFPALLKIYIENVCVDGVTFRSGAQGLKGLCRAKNLVFLTTRGGFYTGGALDMGSRYLDALHTFFGVGAYHCVAADGMDVAGFDSGSALRGAMAQARALAASL